MDTNRNNRLDFEQAMGETFGEYVSPPVAHEDASPHECCEVIWKVTGRQVTPSTLAALTEIQLTALCVEFANYFETEAPSIDRIKAAIAATLQRWPISSLDVAD